MAEFNRTTLRSILAAMAKGNVKPLEELDQDELMEQVKFAMKRGLIAADGALRGAAMGSGNVDLNACHITQVGRMWLRKLG